MNVPTPHNSAQKSDFAKTVLMPGDPLRAKFIAENFLEGAVLVNNVRGIQGYTGYYNGKRVSVMASGMGMPSMGIYSYELFSFYDVSSIIRIGSAGGLIDSLQLRDIVIGMGACTNSNFANQYDLHGTFAPIASYELLEKAVNNTRRMGIEPHVGNLLSADVFYDDSNSQLDWAKMGVLAVEMETAALYMNAARSNKKALSICTISDMVTDTAKSCTAQEREKTFTDMMKIALETAE